MTKKSKKTPKLHERIPNRFLLTLGVAKRARQLKEGAVPLVDIESDVILPVLTALTEFNENKLDVTLEPRSDKDLLLDEITDFIDTSISPPLGLTKSANKGDKAEKVTVKQDIT